jgi:hypothetical protein
MKLFLKESPHPSSDTAILCRHNARARSATNQDEGKNQDAKKMAAVGDGVSSCGSTNVRRAVHLLPLPIPLPCVGEPTAASRVSPGSSPTHSEASGGAACYAADAEPEPDPEVSVGRSTQMLLAMAAMGGRGAQYGRRPASSYGSCAAWSAGSLTKHRPASPSPICSPVSSLGGGCEDPEPHGGGDASSFATPRLVSSRVLDALYRCSGYVLARDGGDSDGSWFLI